MTTRILRTLPAALGLFALTACSSPPAEAPKPKPAAAKAPARGAGAAPAPGAAATPGSPSQDGSASLPPEAYTYQPAGRRDPFVSLIGSGTEPAKSAPSRRG